MFPNARPWRDVYHKVLTMGNGKLHPTGRHLMRRNQPLNIEWFTMAFETVRRQLPFSLSTRFLEASERVRSKPSL